MKRCSKPCRPTRRPCRWLRSEVGGAAAVGCTCVGRGELARLAEMRWRPAPAACVLNVAMLALFAYASKSWPRPRLTRFFHRPSVITALSTVLLREKVRAAHVVAIALGLVGVVVALRPQDAFLTVRAGGARRAVGTPWGGITGRRADCARTPVPAVFWTTTFLALGAGALRGPIGRGGAGPLAAVGGSRGDGFGGQLASPRRSGTGGVGGGAV